MVSRGFKCKGCILPAERAPVSSVSYLLLRCGASSRPPSRSWCPVVVHSLPSRPRPVLHQTQQHLRSASGPVDICSFGLLHKQARTICRQPHTRPSCMAMTGTAQQHAQQQPDASLHPSFAKDLQDCLSCQAIELLPAEVSFILMGTLWFTHHVPNLVRVIEFD